MEKLSELVVTRFRLSRAVNALREQGVDVRELSAVVDENARRLRDLRGCITRARMVPVRELLERVPLIVRGMRRSTGKTVQLEIEAGSAELDKAVAERVFPAIVHLIRNADRSRDRATGRARSARQTRSRTHHGRLFRALQHGARAARRATMAAGSMANAWHGRPGAPRRAPSRSCSNSSPCLASPRSNAPPRTAGAAWAWTSCSASPSARWVGV